MVASDPQDAPLKLHPLGLLGSKSWHICLGPAGLPSVTLPSNL